MTYSVRNIVIALVLAAVAAGLVILYTGNVTKQAHDQQQNVTVVVAKQAIQAGTPIKDLVAQGAFQERSVVQRDVIPGAYTSVDDLNQSLATNSTIAAGSQVTPAMLSESNNTAIVSQIHGTMRAVQVAFNTNRVLGGTLKAGDRVDIIAQFSIQPVLNNSPYSPEDAARVVLSDIEVLSTFDTGVANAPLTAASSAQNSSGTDDGSGGSAVILAIPQDQLASFQAARLSKNWWFALRPVGKDAVDVSPSPLETVCSLMGKGMSVNEIHKNLPVCLGGK
jgi:Flp pilus assembly protein CpaB